MTVTLPLTLDLADEAATQTLAGRLAPLATAGDLIALSGPLGAGKTSFARAFVRARGGGPDVPSPTFTLVEIYEPASGPTIWHVDLYRINDPAEAWELGIEDAFADAVSLIEWPERLGPLLPAERLDVALQHGAGTTLRRARITGSRRWAARLAELDLG